MKAVWGLFEGILGLLWTLLKWPLIIFAIFLFVLFLGYLAWYLYLRYYKKIKPIPNDGLHYNLKEDNIFKKLWLALKQIAKDNLTRDPAEYRPRDGARIILFAGRQGMGKTMTCVKHLMDAQTEWPHLKVATNFEYKYQDAIINHWQDMIDLDNGNRGYILAIDEAQVYWSARDYRNFDVSMLQEITTQRKQNKKILMTSQSFHYLDKNIRCQVHEIHQCLTLARCFTIVVVREPIMTYSGDVEKLKFRRMYCYNHTDKLREAYDTLLVIQNLRDKGFVERSEQLGKFNDSSVINVKVEEPKKKK